MSKTPTDPTDANTEEDWPTWTSTSRPRDVSSLFNSSDPLTPAELRSSSTQPPIGTSRPSSPATKSSKSPTKPTFKTRLSSSTPAPPAPWAGFQSTDQKFPEPPDNSSSIQSSSGKGKGTDMGTSTATSIGTVTVGGREVLPSSTLAPSSFGGDSKIQDQYVQIIRKSQER